jgi:hypothetical protein
MTVGDVLLYKMRYECKRLEHAGFKTFNSAGLDCTENISLNATVHKQDYQLSEPLSWD